MKKSREEIRQVVLGVLHRIAPEADLDELDPDALLQEEIELDSMDFLRFVQEIDKELKRDIPESDYTRISTLNGCLDYLSS